MCARVENPSPRGRSPVASSSPPRHSTKQPSGSCARRPASRRLASSSSSAPTAIPNRDPRGNIVSIAYLAVGPDIPDLVAGSDADDARLCPVTQVVDESLPLAFDHRRILLDALATAEARLQDSDLATAFVGPEFTLSELRGVYEAVWGEPLDAANFRRSLALDSPVAYAAPVGVTSEPGPAGGRPPERYRATENWTLAGSPVRRPRRKDGPSAPRAPRS